MHKRKELLDSIANRIADYRQGEIRRDTPATINEWLQQFPNGIQEPLLSALDSVLRKTYVSRESFKTFLKGLASTEKLSSGSDPGDYWKDVNFLDIQRGGSSQVEILAMFDEVLQETYGFGIDQTGSPDGEFIYLDDCIGTGTRVLGDVCDWLETVALPQIRLHIITPIIYKGSWWVDEKIRKAATENGKTIHLKKWSLDKFRMENRRRYRNQSDVLWPTSIPDNEAVRHYCAYLEGLGYPPVLRESGNPGILGIFENDAQKILMEDAFLIRGCEIRQKQTAMPDVLRPLGYHNLDTLGFGSMFITFRNCPNNCPLPLWVDQQVYPALFPRKTNTETSDEKL